MTLTDVIGDRTYRTLAEDTIRAAFDAIDIELAQVGFGEQATDELHSWLCFLVDPAEPGHLASETVSSAVDHLELLDPGGVLRERGSRVAVRIFELVLADEASMWVRDEHGERVLTSPWARNLAVARAAFAVRTELP